MSKENWPHQIPDDDLRCKLLAAALREKETGTIGSFNRRERKDGESLIDSLDIERLHQQSFIQYVGDRLKEKEFSAKELALAYFDKIKKTDNEIGAYLSLSETLAISQAEEADKEIALRLSSG